MRRNWKRLGAMLLALVMVLSLVPTAALAARITDDAISIDAPGAEADIANPAAALDAGNTPAQLAEGEISPATRYDGWAQLTGSAGSRTKTVSDTKNSVAFQAADYNGNNFNASSGNNSVWTNATINAALLNYTGETRWVSFDMVLSTANAFWSFGLWAKDTTHAFQCAIKDNNGWFTEYFGTQTGWPDWNSGNPSGGFGTDKHHIKVSWTDPDGGTPVVTLTIDGTDYNVPIDASKVTGLDKTTQNFAFRVGNGTGATITNVRYSGEPEGQAVSGQVTGNGGGVEGATVIMGGMTAFTDASGNYSFEYVPKGTHTAMVTPPSDIDLGSATSEVIVGESAVTGKDFVLPAPITAITGKVTTDGTTTLPGATVGLVQNNASYTFEASKATATTGEDGTYSLPVSGVADGTYYVRVSMVGHGAKIANSRAITISGHKVTINDAANDVQLPAFDDTAYQQAGYSIKTFTFEDNETHPQISNGATNPTGTSEVTDGALVLTFTGRARENQLMRLANTPLKNGEVEFDVTRTGGNGCRFGLGLRVGAGKQEGESDFARWIYVGQFASSSAWGYEYWNGSTGTSFWSDNLNGPSFQAGETRHIKVKIENTQVSLWVDGVTVFENANLKQKSPTNTSAATFDPPTIAGDAGFLYGDAGGGGASDSGDTITIDNLRVVRFDPAFAVTVDDTVANGTLNVTNNNIAQGETWDKARTSEGDVIVVSGAGDTGYALNEVSVTKADDPETTITPTPNANGTFQFAMPAYAVTVSGTFLPKVTGVTISGDLKVNKTVTANVEPSAADGNVSYQWYHLNNESQDGEEWVACTDATAKTKTIAEEDNGKKIKVVVTGNGTDYASTVSAEAVSAEAVAPADVPVQTVTFQRSNITMWSNMDTDPDSASTSTEGKTTTVTATIAPTTATLPLTVTWTSSNAEVASLTKTTEQISTAPAEGSPLVATDTLTANKAGTATITCTVRDATGATVNCTTGITVTVKTRVDSIVVKKGETGLTEAAPLVIYNNADHADHSATVNATLTPATATENNLVWTREGGAQGLIRLGRSAGATEDDAAGQSAVITAIGASALDVGEVTVKVKAPSTNPGEEVSATFKVKVMRELAADHNVTIVGTMKFGETLSVNTDNLIMSDENKANLKYQWKRTKNSATENIGTAVKGADGKSYTLVEADIGATISVEVTTDEIEFYTGTKTASRSETVAKADATAMPPETLLGHAVETENGSDGYISGLTASTAYEISSDNGTNWTSKTTDGTGNITGLAAGTYLVRIPADDTHNASESRSATVGAYGSVLYKVTVSAMTNGTVTLSGAGGQYAPNAPVTLTVMPNTGYQLKASTLKVMNGETEVTVEAVSGQANQFTFQMPAAAVTVSAEFELTKVKITDSLTNGITCNLASHDVDWGTLKSIQLVKAEGYNFPTSIAVTNTTTGNALDSTKVTYSNATGLISFPDGVKENITITAAGEAIEYTVQFTLGEGRLTGQGPTGNKVGYKQELTATLRANTGYEVPETITVTMGGTTLAAGTGYTYTPASDKASATITIAQVTGNVVITASGVVKKIPLTSVAITISHLHTAEGDSGATEANVPHVGDTLRADVTATGSTGAITATYTWYVGGVAVEDLKDTSHQSYEVRSGDVGKAIKVVVSGTGNFSGEVDATTPAVKTATIAAQSISLNKTSTSIVFGQSETLTATVTPSNATDKTVTWSVISGQDVVSVANGAVTALKVGNATVRAADSAGHTATCTVTVTAAPVSVAITGTAQVGKVLTATFTPSGVTASDFHSVTWYRVGAGDNGSDLEIASGLLTYTPVAADVGYYIKVTASEAIGNYAGSPSATTSAAVLSEGAEAPTYDVTVAATEHGSVTADKAKAAAGDTVTLTVTPATGYKLDTLTVKDADNAPVTVTAGNTFVMPAKAVTVTATFVVDTTVPPTVDTAALEQAIADANTAKSGVSIGTTAEEVTSGTKFVTSEEMKALTDAIAAAETAKNAADKTQASVDAAKTALETAVTAFNAAIKTGTKTGGSSSGSGSSRPSTSTETTTNPDGSKTTTVTDNRTGTVTATTEKPDGTKEVVEAKKDGTVTETVTTPDGAKTEKVTTKDGDVAITATDAEGETIAKVEIPAEVPAPEAKFEDIGQAPWAEEAINKVAGLKLVEGTGDNKYAPVAPMTRGALATVLHRLSQGKTNYNATFQDVAAGKYYTEGVAWAAKAGVVKGFSADIFAPEQIITREQLAVMLARYAKVIGLDASADANALDTFTDGDSIGAWAVDGMAWCVANGILQGKGNSTLAPTAQVTRAEVAVMLDRFIALIK